MPPRCTLLVLIIHWVFRVISNIYLLRFKSVTIEYNQDT